MFEECRVLGALVENWGPLTPYSALLPRLCHSLLGHQEQLGH